MVNPEWGTKRVCPTCSVKFYDFNHEQPLTCPSCAQTFTPELLLRSRRGRPLEVDQDDNNEDDEFDGVETDEDEDDAETIKEISADDAVMPVSGGDDDDDDDIGDDINVGADDSDLDDDDDVLIDDDDDVGVDDDLDDEFDEDETR